MDRDSSIELINETIKKLLEERRSKTANPEDEKDEEKVLLSRLLSQLEQLKVGDTASMGEIVSQASETGADGEEEKFNKEDSKDISNEIKEVKKQNSRTHWLLSALIVLTLTWQLSEVSLLLKIKDGFRHPLKSLGRMFVWKFRPKEVVIDAEKLVQPAKNERNNHDDGHPVPHLKMPELPQIVGGQND